MAHGLACAEGCEAFLWWGGAGHGVPCSAPSSHATCAPLALPFGWQSAQAQRPCSVLYVHTICNEQLIRQRNQPVATAHESASTQHNSAVRGGGHWATGHCTSFQKRFGRFCFGFVPLVFVLCDAHSSSLDGRSWLLAFHGVICFDFLL